MTKIYDPRNKASFWALVRATQSREYARTHCKGWWDKRTCPPITPSALAHADAVLGQPPGTALFSLTGCKTLAEFASEHAHKRALARKKRVRHLLIESGRCQKPNDDGSYTRTCGWCNGLFFSRTGRGHKCCPDCARGNLEYVRRSKKHVPKPPTLRLVLCVYCERGFSILTSERASVCADCAEGNRVYRQRLVVDSGRKKDQDKKDRIRAKYKRQSATAFRKPRDDLRRAVARLERQLERDVLPLYRAKYRAERKANAEAIARDLNRRAKKRRRALDPIGTYDNSRASRQWVWGVLQDFGYSCAYCGMSRAESKAKGFDLQIDHLFPLGHALCESGPRNAVPACISCNASKGNRDPIAWMKSKGYTPSEKVLDKIEALMPRRVSVPTQETIW